MGHAFFDDLSPQTRQSTMDLREIEHPEYMPADSSDNIARDYKVITDDFDDDDVMDDPKVGIITAS